VPICVNLWLNFLMNDQNLLEDQPVAWTPTPDVVERAQLTKFMRQVGVATWDELYAYSINDVEKFTEEVLKFLDIRFDPPYEKLLDTTDGIEFPEWFKRSANLYDRSADTPVRMNAASAFKDNAETEQLSIDEDIESAASVLAGGTGDADKSVRSPSAGLNITKMCLDRWQTDEMKDQPAVIWECEEGKELEWTYGELFEAVESLAGALRWKGFVKGDAIGIHLPMMAETVAVLLAIGRIGAIAVPVFSGYGVDAIASRLNAVDAKALFTCDGFPRRGKPFDAFSVADQASALCPNLDYLFTIGRIDEDFWGESKHCISTLPIVQLAVKGEWVHDSLLDPEPTSAEDPLIILYTSGTTGKPKGIAHTHASFPIKAAQDMAFGTDVGKGTRISWYTDIGWMMGPWLIYGALINGATICIYDGAPDYPTPDRMWEFCAKHKVEVLGISPTLVRSLAAAEERSADTPVRMSAKHEQRSPRRGWYRHGGLPHFDGTVTQFITFRLADSLPAPVLESLKLQLQHDKLEEDSEEYRTRVEDYLDKGAGECILHDPAVAAIVQETLLNENGNSCDLRSWVIMPNHVHILVRMREGHDLAGFMKRIKGVSARKINQYLGQTGSVWQENYFDRYIRDEEHFVRVAHYIQQNPVVAGLVSSPEEWKFGGSVAASGDADKSVRAPFERHDLSSLRAFASTGEPWNPAPWWWLFEKVGNSKLPIINYSGGTEIAGGILMGNPLLPIKPCSFPAPCPGMDVDILDEDGKPVPAGKVGELVIKQPWIGMARGFWQEKERYLDAYWRRFAGIWVHGDFAMRDKDNHWFILGRSDDTLKVAGKRVGPAEVESLLVAHPLVTEAAVIGVPDEVKGTAMVAFCSIER
jgi:acyl-coenzyme A synthetase/AMP-(fatty) acid ligase/REP element-mobilizing transposase RayT